MKRRQFLLWLAAGGAAAAAWRYWPDEGIFNPCLPGPLPERLARHDLVQAAWDGVAPDRFWDCHVHLVGVGAGGTGVWITPRMKSLWHPIQYAQRVFYQNSGCAEREGTADADYLARLVALHSDLRPGAKLMLLAFEHFYAADGRLDLERTTYHTPNAYARAVARRHPDKFEWIASIHPYRADAVMLLEQAVRDGARAVKWLPSAMGMDPAAPGCDPFYEALARSRIPLLTHGGGELAVLGGAEEELNNPLRLRRPLEHGVRVIVAHCAALGSGVDLDRGPNGPRVPNFDLFARLMDEPRHEGLILGDISAMTQVNRLGPALDTVIRRGDWHGRLINGSDYPLPAVMPLFSMRALAARGDITAAEGRILSEIRRYNPLLFDFVLKRRLKVGGKRLAPAVFETRRRFIRR